MLRTLHQLKRIVQNTCDKVKTHRCDTHDPTYNRIASFLRNSSVE